MVGLEQPVISLVPAVYCDPLERSVRQNQPLRHKSRLRDPERHRVLEPRPEYGVCLVEISAGIFQLKRSCSSLVPSISTLAPGGVLVIVSVSARTRMKGMQIHASTNNA